MQKRRRSGGTPLDPHSTGSAQGRDRWRACDAFTTRDGMAAAGGRLLVVNGVLQTSEAPPISAFLEGISGAYTTTRTYGDASVVLFWERHLRRLADSARILAESRAVPRFFRPPPSRLRQLVGDSLRVGLRKAMKERRCVGGGGEELAITALVRGWEEEELDVRRLDVYVHVGFYVPQVLGTGARLAVAGHGRERAEAKSTDWVRVRKHMEKLRPPLTTELLLSNDGDRILEGSVTNFFVVCRRKKQVINTDSDESLSDPDDRYSVEVQTAPVSDGVLPGVIRQLVIEICSKKRIPFQEVAPSWADRELWEEAFITNSLRLLQHVEIIQAPTSCEDLHLKTWREVSWLEKQFEGPGIIATEIQRAILEQACSDGLPLGSLL